jgi:hypothetical protein
MTETHPEESGLNIAWPNEGDLEVSWLLPHIASQEKRLD